LILGHQIVGQVEKIGEEMWEEPERPDSRGTKAAPTFRIRDRVGIPWLGWTDGNCAYCRSGRENLCDNARFTGYAIDGGYAEFTVADARYCFHLPKRYDDVEVAPLLCAGLIGYRSYRKTGEAQRLGMYGFGNAAHLIAQIALHEGRKLFVFTRPGDAQGQAFARGLGAAWAGGADERPPVELDAAIVFAPVGALVPAALVALRKGGRVVCGGIHMSDIPSFAYRLLWGERQVRSVANLTRQDAADFFAFVARHPLRVETSRYPLAQANEALGDLRAGRIEGAAVLVP
jgi:propanol-preferring alcohol dehydrogenase